MFNKQNTALCSGLLAILFPVLVIILSNCRQSAGTDTGTQDVSQLMTDTTLPLRQRVLPLIARARIDDALKLLTASGQSAAKPLRVAWETANKQFLIDGKIDYDEWSRIQNRTMSGIEVMLEPMATPAEKVPARELEQMIDNNQFEEAFARLERAGYEEAYLHHGRYVNVQRAFYDKKINAKVYDRDVQRIGFALLGLVRE